MLFFTFFFTGLYLHARVLQRLTNTWIHAHKYLCRHHTCTCRFTLQMRATSTSRVRSLSSQMTEIIGWNASSSSSPHGSIQKSFNCSKATFGIRKSFGRSCSGCDVRDFMMMLVWQSSASLKAQNIVFCKWCCAWSGFLFRSSLKDNKTRCIESLALTTVRLQGWVEYHKLTSKRGEFHWINVKTVQKSLSEVWLSQNLLMAYFGPAKQPDEASTRALGTVQRKSRLDH